MSVRKSLAALIVLFIPAGAGAVPFTFTNTADSSGSFAYFSLPAINNVGDVAFSAGLDAGSVGFFVVRGGLVIPIITFSESFRPFGDPDINDRGTVAFSSILDSGASGVFVGQGGPVTPIATASPFNGAGFPSINDSGAVAFVANLVAGGGGIFINNGGTIRTVADTSGVFDGFYRGPSINNRGTAAFLATFDDAGGAGIFMGDGGPTIAIADTSGPFSFFNGPPAINDRGTVAFTAGLKSGRSGVFIANGGSPVAIADDSGPFRSFDATPSINNGGAVAFFAFLDTGTYGLFVGADPMNDRVIALGDPLFGSTVTSLGGLRAALNDTGEVAFLYYLADGRSGIARAVPVPAEVAEPGSFSLLATALVVPVFLSCVSAKRRAQARMSWFTS
jgi:hypothetical protein